MKRHLNGDRMETLNNKYGICIMDGLLLVRVQVGFLFFYSFVIRFFFYMSVYESISYTISLFNLFM